MSMAGLSEAGNWTCSTRCLRRACESLCVLPDECRKLKNPYYIGDELGRQTNDTFMFSLSIAQTSIRMSLTSPSDSRVLIESVIETLQQGETLRSDSLRPGRTHERQ